MSTNPNDPVNPFKWNDRAKTSGITKREYAAIKAMEGILSANSKYQRKESTATEEVAGKAVSVADALIKKLDETDYYNEL